MIILGIDPGNVRAGYGLIKKDGQDFIRIESGIFKIPAETSLGNQLLALEKDMEKLIKKTKPDLVGLEKIFMNKNKKTGVFVAQARGIIVKVSAAYKLKLVELSPSSIKLAVTGDGRADKKAVAKMVGLFLKMKIAGLLDDETDALATAIAASTAQN
ncbi:MAG: crossover junction endodeoxyribonuclease RuvC [Patescibacteria group bacterium]